VKSVSGPRPLLTNSRFAHPTLRKNKYVFSIRAPGLDRDLRAARFRSNVKLASTVVVTNTQSKMMLGLLFGT
jgi:hypothetical protein